MDSPDASTTEPAALPSEVPLFPLPDHVLLPGVRTPYRIFEPRYRALVRDLLRRPEDERWLAVPCLRVGWKDAGAEPPPFHDVVCLVRLTECESQPDGMYHVMVEGHVRARLEERPADTPYRVARVRAFQDLTGPTSRLAVERLMDTANQAAFTLMTLIGRGSEDLAKLFVDSRNGEGATDPDLRVFRLASSFVSDAEDRQAMIEEPDPIARARRVVEALAELLALAHSQKHGAG